MLNRSNNVGNLDASRPNYKNKMVWMDIFRLIVFQIVAFSVYPINCKINNELNNIRIEGSVAKVNIDRDGNEFLEQICKFESDKYKSHTCNVYLRPEERVKIKCSAASNVDSSGVPVNIVSQNGNNKSFESNCNSDFCTANLTYLPRDKHDDLILKCVIKDSNENPDHTHPESESTFMYTKIKLYEKTLDNLIDYNSFQNSKLVGNLFNDVSLENINTNDLMLGDSILTRRRKGGLNNNNSKYNSLFLNQDYVIVGESQHKDEYDCDFTNSEMPGYKNKFYTGVIYPGQNFKFRCPNTSEKTQTTAFPKDLKNVYIMERLENGKHILKQMPLEKISKGLKRTAGVLSYDKFDNEILVYNEIYLICHDSKVTEPVKKLSTLNGVIRILLGYPIYSPPVEEKGLVETDLSDRSAGTEKLGESEIKYFSLPSDKSEIKFKCPTSEDVKYKLLPEEPNFVYYNVPNMQKNPFKNDQDNPQGDIGHAIAMSGIDIVKTEDSVTITRSEDSKIAYGMNPQVFFICAVPKNVDEYSMSNQVDGEWDSKFGAVILEYSPTPTLTNIRICGPGYNSFDHDGIYIEDVDCVYSFDKPTLPEDELTPKSEVKENEESGPEEDDQKDSEGETKLEGVKADGNYLSEKEGDDDISIKTPIVQMCPNDKYNPNGPKCIATMQGSKKNVSKVIDLFENSADGDHLSSLWILESDRWETFKKDGIKQVTCSCYDSFGDVISKLIVNNGTSGVCLITISLGLLASLLIFLL